MAAMFVGQQYLQNVLAYTTFEAGSRFSGRPHMVLIAPRSANSWRPTGRVSPCSWVMPFVSSVSSRCSCSGPNQSPIGRLASGYALIGIGVGFAGTPASHSLTGSVPVKRAGMASGTADLQRDLGGAILQSIFGALLTAGYAAVGAENAPSPEPEGLLTVPRPPLRNLSPARPQRPAYPKDAERLIIAGVKNRRSYRWPGLGVHGRA